jgi:phosphoglycolate phosphatase
MPKISHIIFDWDGTLMDSTDKIVSCMQEAAIRSNLPIPTHLQVKQIIGISLLPAIEMLFSIDVKEAIVVRDHYKSAFLEQDTVACNLFEGAHETLLALSEYYTLAVATGKARRGLTRALQNSNSAHYFDKTRCADDDNVMSKPHPSMLNQLLDEWEITPAQAIMVGDTTHDLKMAAAIDMPRIAVSYGAHNVNELAQYAPVAIIDKLPALFDIVRKNFK